VVKIPIVDPLYFLSSGTGFYIRVPNVTGVYYYSVTLSTEEEEEAPARYTVTVVSAGRNPAGSGEYEEGVTVNIHPGTAPSGQRFVRWTSHDVTFAYANTANTSFIMPANPVTVTAVFETVPDQTTSQPTEPTTRPATEPATEPTTVKPPATEPGTKPVTEPATEPVTTEPATSSTTTEPTVTEPTATGSVTTEPSATEPTTEPVTTESTVTEPTTRPAGGGYGTGGITSGGGPTTTSPSSTVPYNEPEAVGARLPFDDTPTTAWYYADIAWAYQQGLMVGTNALEFSPNIPMTRGMLVTVLHRLAGQPTANLLSAFSDVAVGSWYAQAIAWAHENGIVSGVGDNQFAPNDSITREQAAVILLNYADFSGIAPQGDWAVRLDFEDVDQISDWAVKGAMYAYLKGLIGGKPGKLFDPQGFATRAEVSAILHRFVTKAVNTRS
jgi:hypothetical protein